MGTPPREAVFTSALTSREAVSSYSALLTLKWQGAVSQLLQSKHLYQRFTLLQGEKQNLISRTIAVDKDKFVQTASSLDYALLGIRTKNEPEFKDRYNVIVSNVSLFCSKCNRREGFAPLWVADLEMLMRHPQHPDGPPERSEFPGVQMFIVVFQCQGCLGVPEAFLIRREGLSLRVEGRSPIEQVEVPAFIPKQEKTFYRDAVIASHTGKTLAALFYLRTFIEQFARRVTGLQGKVTGDTILDTYNNSIPEDLRGRMPSLREWYDKLSEAVHGAKEDAELFENAKREIDQHFEIRRVFNIPEQMPSKDA